MPNMGKNMPPFLVFHSEYTLMGVRVDEVQQMSSRT